MDSEVTSRKFYNGYDYPLLGLGTWKSGAGEVFQAVKDAIDIGYRQFDCAFVYGNEAQVGEAFKEKIQEGVVQREDLFVTSKLWSTEHTKDLVVPAIKKSLENLQLDYLDLYLIHWPMGFKEGGELFPFDENNKLIGSDVHFTETWEGMEECVNLGLARSIGLSNFNHLQIEELLAKAKIKPVNNQVECHPYFNQQQLIDYCEERNIIVTAYSPFGSPDRPDIMKDSPTDPSLLEDPIIMAIGEKYNKTSAQILIRYQIQRGVSVIPKTVTKSRIHSNFEVFDFTISDEDMEALNKLNTNERKLKFLLEELPTLLDDVPLLQRQRMILQLDGCPAHKSMQVCDEYIQFFLQFIRTAKQLSMPKASSSELSELAESLSRGEGESTGCGSLGSLSSEDEGFSLESCLAVLINCMKNWTYSLLT